VKEFWQELLRAGLYKPSQGRIARQVTFSALALIVALGVWRLFILLQGYGVDEALMYLVPGLLLAGGLWIAYRLVNLPKFADFLISVQAEMNKVSWPGRGEMVRSSLVVVFTIFFLAGILFFFDLAWQELFTLLKVLPDAGPQG
jgi:preprotein translocase subunit SecE